MCTTHYYVITTNHEYAQSAELVYAKKSQTRSLADSLGSVMCQSNYIDLLQPLEHFEEATWNQK